MLYELRYYEVADQPKSSSLHKLLANHALPLFQKYEIGVLGFWMPWIGVFNQIPCILSFEDMADREAKVRAFEADVDWLEAKAEADSGPRGPIVASVKSSFMKLTSYSPEPKIRSNLHEFRLNVAMPGRIDDLHHLFEHHHSSTLFERHNNGLVGWFTEVVGASDQVFFILEFPDAAGMEKARIGLVNDPEFQRAAPPYEVKGALRRRVWSGLYWLTDYTPRGPNNTAPVRGIYYGYQKQDSPK